jgi:hypothetical protein
VLHLVLVAPLLLAACASGDDTDQLGTGGGGAAGQGGLADPSAAGAGSASGLADSSAGASGVGGASLPEGGGAGDATDDAGLPPLDCIPSCVWDIFKDCLPGPSCVLEHTAASDGGAGDVVARCEPTTGWYSETGGCCSPGFFTTVSVNGVPCYTARWGGKAPFSGKFYSRADGSAEAIIAHDFTSYACGLSGTPSGPLEPTRPDCAPWFDRIVPTDDCAVGECSPP